MAFARLNQKAQGRKSGNVTARTYSIPAPIKGLNRKSSLTDMELSEALQLDNFIPGNGSVKLRKGSSSLLTVPNSSGHVDSDTLGGDRPMTYVLVLDENRAIAGWDGLCRLALKAHQTGGGATVSIGATEIFPLTDTDFTSWAAFLSYPIRFNNSAGSFVVLNINGGNPTTGNPTLVAWDGDSFIKNTFTSPVGLPYDDYYVGLAVFAGRIWIFDGSKYIYADEPNVNIGYFPVGQMGGTVTNFPLSGQVTKGGYVIHACGWTRDGGDGIDDYFCVFTSQGEVVIYQGTDPSSINDWAKVGVFDIGEPVTTDIHAFRKCVMKVGGDLGIMTKRGVAMLSQLLDTNKSGHEKISVTHKVSKLYLDAVAGATTMTAQRTYGMCELPAENCIIINMWDAVATKAQQLILNVDTGAWSRWTGIDAYQWFNAGSDLYWIGRTGIVYKYGGLRDNPGSVAIPWKIQTSFTMLKTPQGKSLKAIRPHFTAMPNYMPKIDIKVDFDMTDISTSSGSYTDLGLSANSGNPVQNAQWTTVNAEGYSFSIIMQGTCIDAISFEYHALDLMYETGGFL